MKSHIQIIIILILVSGRLTGQTFADCKRSEKHNQVLLESVNANNWTSKSIYYNSNPVNYLYSFDSTNNWNFGIKLTQQFNYPFVHTSPTLSIYRKNHNLHIGPEYTHLLEKSIGDPVDNYQQEYRGINIGYRYIFDSRWKKTNLFLQLDFSIYQLIHTEYSLGYCQAKEIKWAVVENNIAVGVNYKLFNRFGILGGIGFGSTNGFFLMLDHFIPHSFLGIEYKIKK